MHAHFVSISKTNTDSIRHKQYVWLYIFRINKEKHPHEFRRMGKFKYMRASNYYTAGSERSDSENTNGNVGKYIKLKSLHQMTFLALALVNVLVSGSVRSRLRVRFRLLRQDGMLLVLSGYLDKFYPKRDTN